MMSLKFREKENNKYFSRLTQSVADHQNLQVVTIKDVPSKQNSLPMSVLFLIETGFDQVGTRFFFFFHLDKWRITKSSPSQSGPNQVLSHHFVT